ncbi:mechanosensitive ion channel family protein [Corallococcus sp. CA031C]|uniref:mechanosensitive ion channel family protein n=1 Tax=Corallococcus sp. CA031C TaxID=2316725 RepID=UPI001F2FCBE0|nr:mechanosensitive ion channel domain-containing protein [Corallococcus sp. CA031C]
MRRSVPPWMWLLLLLGPVGAFALNAGLPPPPSDVDRRTPAATAAGFLDAAHARDAVRAPQYLDLSRLPPSTQAEEGLRLARRLVVVLDRTLWLDFARIGREPAGPGERARREVLGQVATARGPQDIILERVDAEGGPVWVFSADTVGAIDALFAEHGSPLLERLPPVFFTRPLWVLEAWQWLGLAALLAGAWVLGQLGEALALRLGARAAGLTKSGWDDELLAAGRGTMRHVLGAMIAATGARLLMLPPPAQGALDLGARSIIIVASALFLLRFFTRAARFLETRVAQSPEGTDVARVRGLRTQLSILRRVVEVAVVLVAASLLLLQFEAVRNVGVSLLASAGLAGLVIGLAAQKSISTLLAGIQLSITQPIRIGDTVIVENEWGWVEEITLTYVVVKVWDLRRLVIPITQFLEKPFQNWSKVSPDILGTAELYVDFRTDVPAVRAELKRILDEESKGLWDGKAQGLQVTDLSERTMKLRALVSASDAGKAFDLRCLVREKLVAYLQAQPHGLPLLRAEASPLSFPEQKAPGPALVPARPGNSARVEPTR